MNEDQLLKIRRVAFMFKSNERSIRRFSSPSVGWLKPTEIAETHGGPLQGTHVRYVLQSIVIPEDCCGVPA